MDGLKLLCLHGWGTSGEFMKFQMETWVKKYPNTEFIFVNGVHKFPSLFSGDPDIIEFHGTDKQVYDNLAASRGEILWPINPKNPVTYYDIPEVDRLANIINDHKGVDGMFSFSQGGILLSLFVYHMELGLLNSILPKENRPYFALISGPPAGAPLKYQLKMPAQFMFGNLDKVTATAFINLTRYQNAEYVFFEGGHRPPRLGRELYRKVNDFVAKAKVQKDKYRNTDSILLSQAKL